MSFRKANREDPDQTASSALFDKAFVAGNYCSKNILEFSKMHIIKIISQFFKFHPMKYK